MTEPRKKCETCHRFLLAQNGHYMHPEKPCNGIHDYIDIEASIGDEFLHNKFIELYGKPDMDDYERLEMYEKQIKGLQEIIKNTAPLKDYEQLQVTIIQLTESLKYSTERTQGAAVRAILWLKDRLKRK